MQQKLRNASILSGHLTNLWHTGDAWVLVWEHPCQTLCVEDQEELDGDPGEDSQHVAEDEAHVEDEDIDDIGEEKTFYRRRIAGLAMNEIAATLKDSKRPSRTLRDPWETGSYWCSLLNWPPSLWRWLTHVCEYTRGQSAKHEVEIQVFIPEWAETYFVANLHVGVQFIGSKCVG